MGGLQNIAVSWAIAQIGILLCVRHVTMCRFVGRVDIQEESENRALLGYYAANSGNFLPNFRNKPLVPYSGFEPEDGADTLSRNVLRNYHYRCIIAKFLYPVDGTDKLPRNVGKILPLLVA